MRTKHLKRQQHWLNNLSIITSLRSGKSKASLITFKSYLNIIPFHKHSLGVTFSPFETSARPRTLSIKLTSYPDEDSHQKAPNLRYQMKDIYRAHSHRLATFENIFVPHHYSITTDGICFINFSVLIFDFFNVLNGTDMKYNPRTLKVSSTAAILWTWALEKSNALKKESIVPEYSWSVNSGVNVWSSTGAVLFPG